MIWEWGATDCVVVGAIHRQLVFTEAVEVKVGLSVVRETEICLLVESLCRLCVCMCVCVCVCVCTHLCVSTVATQYKSG